MIGAPHKITTVDKYQGQQNDYVLISLVRTKAVGHLRDVRRLVVAASRARLGLYIFGRVSLFKNCFELQPTFKLLMQRPQQLQLIDNETYPSERMNSDKIIAKVMSVADMTEMAQFVYKKYMTKVDAMKEEMEKMREIYDQMPKPDEPKVDTTEKKKDDSKVKESLPFMPIPIRNEIDEEVLSYAGELQGPTEKKQKTDDVVEEAPAREEEEEEEEQQEQTAPQIRQPMEGEEIAPDAE